jgi:hypothetical protein
MKKLVALFLLIGAPFARPDSCVLPATTGYISDDGTTVVRIEFGWPEELGPAPRQMQMPTKCIARIARWNEKDRSYRFLRSVVLRNRIGPGEAVITNDARFLVTFDEFCESGMSENAVVIYDLEKNITVSCGIEDFLPKAYRESLHRTISHIDWRDAHPYLNDEDRKVWIAPDCRSKGDFSVVVDLTSYSITLSPPQPQ